MTLLVRGECSRCGELLDYFDPARDDGPANLFLTVPGRGAFKGTVWQAELVCKNAYQCVQRQAVQ